MFQLSTTYKAFAAALTGLALVVLTKFVADPTLLAAVGAVLTTFIVWRVPNDPT